MYAIAIAALVLVAGATLIAVLLFTARLGLISERLWFAGAIGLGALWIGAFAVNLFVGDDTWTLWIQAIALATSSMIPLFWLGFTLAYVGRRDWLNAPTFVLLTFIPAATVGILLAEQVYGLGLVRAEAVFVTIDGVHLAEFEYGPWGLLQVGYSYLLLALALALAVDLAMVTRPPYREQGVILASAVGLPIAASGIDLLAPDLIGGMDPTPVALAGTGLLLGVGIRSYDLLIDVPMPTQVAHEAVLASLESPVVVLNAAGEIRHTTPSITQIVDLDPDDLRGRDGDVLPGIDLDETGQVTIEPMIECPDTPVDRRYALRSTPLTDARDRRYGTIVLYQDSTDLYLREQRLNVLNRVLRHDIRNEMSIILGHAQDGLEASTDRDANFEIIAETARSVVHTADSARRIEQLLPLSDVHAEGTVAEAVARFEERAQRHGMDVDVTIDVEVPPETVVPTGFSAVMWHLVDGGFDRQSGSKPPTVTVAPAGDHWLAITVEAAGFDRTEEEHAVFEHGEVTQLDHASGLGLWLVHWVVGEYGGTVDVDGATISVTLPRP